MGKVFLGFTMKMDDETKLRLQVLSDEARRSMSAQIRFWIDKAWDERKNRTYIVNQDTPTEVAAA